MMLNQVPQQKESIFISGLDNTISEKEVAEIFRYTIGTANEAKVVFHRFPVNDHERVLAELICSVEEAVTVHNRLNNQKLKSCYMKLIPQQCMKQLVVTNLPKVFSDKDLFLILYTMTPGIHRVIVADDPEVCGKTLCTAVVIYTSYEAASAGLEKLQGAEVMKKQVKAYWKEPNYDVIQDLSLETRTLYIKNLSWTTTSQKIRQQFQSIGEITKIRKFANKAFIEFKTPAMAKKAFEMMNEKRVDGLVWRIYPARKLDEERLKDQPDKNLIFSKNFLEENDGQVLMKYAFDGSLPELNPKVQASANAIMERIKYLQSNQIQLLEMQCENMRKMQQGNAFGSGVMGKKQQQNNGQWMRQDENMNPNFGGASVNPNIQQGMNNMGKQAGGNNAMQGANMQQQQESNNKSMGMNMGNQGFNNASNTATTATGVGSNPSMMMGNQNPSNVQVNQLNNQSLPAQMDKQITQPNSDINITQMQKGVVTSSNNLNPQMGMNGMGGMEEEQDEEGEMQEGEDYEDENMENGGMMNQNYEQNQMPRKQQFQNQRGRGGGRGGKKFNKFNNKNFNNNNGNGNNNNMGNNFNNNRRMNRGGRGGRGGNNNNNNMMYAGF